jgi:REP element-mobilizing transposase RayT
MGTKGWHRRGYLPHFDSHDLSQHVVFRLFDAVPRDLDGGDDVLDQNHGSAVLRDPGCATFVAETLLFGDRTRYALQAWCVMPNHVHVLIATGAGHELGNIVRSWKVYSTRRINALMARSGQLWATDYFDRFIRNQRHFETTKRYIEMNPVSAGLCASPRDWRFSSAGWA